jgi:hypothetical protein
MAWVFNGVAAEDGPEAYAREASPAIASAPAKFLINRILDFLLFAPSGELRALPIQIDAGGGKCAVAQIKGAESGGWMTVVTEK